MLVLYGSIIYALHGMVFMPSIMCIYCLFVIVFALYGSITYARH